MHVHLTLKSANGKTGPIPVSTSDATTCPDACALKARGCYAKSGPLALHWSAVTRGARGMPWAAFVRTIAHLPAGQLWRHNQAGDLPGAGDAINGPALASLAKANAIAGARGFTYTHKPVLGSARTVEHNRAAIASAVSAGFIINLSADNLTDADDKANLGIAPVVVVLPKDAPKHQRTPAGRLVVTCPAQLSDNVTCATCQLCARPGRAFIVGFRAHGTGAAAADRIARLEPGPAAEARRALIRSASAAVRRSA